MIEIFSNLPKRPDPSSTPVSDMVSLDHFDHTISDHFKRLPLYTILYLVTVDSTNCMSSLGTDHKWNDNGFSSQCRSDMKAGRTRLCLKFKTGKTLKNHETLI